MRKWFVTWNRPEYKEWASEIQSGYLLVIIRKEKNRYLTVKAEVIMKDKGLPDFKILEEHYFSIKRDSARKIREWKKFN